MSSLKREMSPLSESQKEIESVAPKSEQSADNFVRTVDLEALGKIEEEKLPGGETEKRLKLPDDVILGSEDRQRRIEKTGRNKTEKERDLHSIEITTDFVEPTGKYGEWKPGGHREYAYEQTPDGRVHSSKAVLEYPGVGAPDGTKKIVESRIMSKDSRVTSASRMKEKRDGTVEMGQEKLSYDSLGKVELREHTLEKDGKVLSRTETRLDPDDPTKIIVTVTREERSGHKPSGTKYRFDGGEEFLNGFNSDMLKMLED